MSDRPTDHPLPAGSRGPAGRFAAGFARTIKTLIVRCYALAILLVVVWAGYTAVAFLARSVFTPAAVPPQYRGWQTALSHGQFQPETAQNQNLAVPRAPAEHYHVVDRALPADLHNGCVASGCHNALAHTRHKETRAFVNLHATFLACGMCHETANSGPMRAMWVDTATGKRADPPAALRLAAYLQDNAATVQSAPAEVHAKTVELLARAVEIAQDPVLHYLQLQLSTSEPGSPAWRHAMTQLVEELPNHARGEYGAKLTRDQGADELAQSQRRLADLTGRYQDAAEGSPDRNRLYDDIHAGIIAKPAPCLTCHGGEPPRLDFLALGYATQRAAALRDSAIARLMQQIQEGRPFHLPRLLENRDGR